MTTTPERYDFQPQPDRYVHWRFRLDADDPSLARLTMDVQEDQGLRSDYVLKLNSYDLSVDIELAAIVQRLRFEYPQVRCVVVDSTKDRCFCAGANIMMLRGSTHAFKVNFCKFTNETRLSIEDASQTAGIRFLAALNGTCAGGGYELALACDEIVLVDDGNSAVSLPEVPLLGVLPGTGGLTRVVDKRKVRRDLADVFCTVAEGIKGKRAVDWKLVDAVAPRSRFEETVRERARALAASSPARTTRGITLTPVEFTQSEDGLEYPGLLTVELDATQRIATVTLRGPSQDAPAEAAAALEQGARFWPLALFRAFDHALLKLRFEYPEIGLVVLKSQGELERVAAYDALLASRGQDWFLGEVVGQIKRTLKRLDVTSRSFFALLEPGSCFGGTLFEVALACDRIYAMDNPDEPVELELSAVNVDGSYPTASGWTRLESRFYGDPQALARVRESLGRHEAVDANKLGLVTDAPDDLDWDTDVRLAIEERASYSPDALTGMEASLRWPGPETLETKIFGRLSAWQNWIFQRPNAVGERGALRSFGEPTQPEFDWRRV